MLFSLMGLSTGVNNIKKIGLHIPYCFDTPYLEKMPPSNIHPPLFSYYSAAMPTSNKCPPPPPLFKGKERKK